MFGCNRQAMFERYTEQARRALLFARYEASQFGSRTIDSEHLLLGLLRDPRGVTGKFLAHANLAVDDVRDTIESHLARGQKIAMSVEIPFTGGSNRILNFAAAEADRLQHDYVGSEHLLLGILREEQSRAASVLKEKGLRLDMARDEIARLPAQRTLPNPLDQLQHLAEQLAHAERNSREAAELLAEIFQTIDALKAYWRRP